VDLYVGGSEHAVLHLLYARFWHKVLYDLGVVKDVEPFLKLVHQGVILGMTHRWYAAKDETGRIEALDGDSEDVVRDSESWRLQRASTGAEVEARYASDAELEMRDGAAYHAPTGVRVVSIAEKMSKSRGNVVNPDTVVEQFGADALRLYEMFMGPLEQAKPWQTSGIQGVRRFLDRVDALGQKPISDTEMPEETARLVHRTVKKVGQDIAALRHNTAVSAMMILANHLAGLEKCPRAAFERLVLCLAPFAPHLAEELWGALGHAPSIADVPWPDYDEALCVDEVVEIAVQVNGRVRGRVRLSADASEAEAAANAMKDPAVQKAVGQQAVRRTVYVPGRILNLILGPRS